MRKVSKLIILIENWLVLILFMLIFNFLKIFYFVYNCKNCITLDKSLTQYHYSKANFMDYLAIYVSQIIELAVYLTASTELCEE